MPDDNAGKTPFRLWDPHERRLAPVNAKPGTDFDDEEEPGTIAGVELYENGGWITAEGKLEGSHRIRLHAGMKAGVQYFKLWYYFEILEKPRHRLPLVGDLSSTPRAAASLSGRPVTGFRIQFVNHRKRTRRLKGRWWPR